MDQLEGSVQAYAWGDRETIAAMQGRAAPEQPEAELWLGAHPVAPSRLLGEGCSLADAVSAQPLQTLGGAVVERFGRFPYLLKVLAAGEPLSIQAHPSLAQAKAGFAREDGAGIPWDSPQRTYRDDNHKPELICALTNFEAKCGFRPIEETRLLVGALARSITDSGTPAPGLSELVRRLDSDGTSADVLSGVLGWLLRLSETEASTLVIEAVEAADRVLSSEFDGDGVAAGDSPLASYGPDLHWTGELYRFYPGDVGVVVGLLLNHVSLRPGQAMFLHAGNLHSYLRGAGVELMANSDNVVRGGLTVKHVDVDELLDVVDATPGPAPVQTATGPDHRFDSPVPEFSLSRLVGPLLRRFEPAGPEILLVTEGVIAVRRVGSDHEVVVGPGQSAFVAAEDGPYELRPEGEATAWRATVGDLAL